MAKLAHQKRGKPRARAKTRRGARLQSQELETRASLRRWAGAARRTGPGQPSA